jgi:hypothetical protein
VPERDLLRMQVMGLSDLRWVFSRCRFEHVMTTWTYSKGFRWALEF